MDIHGPHNLLITGKYGVSGRKGACNYERKSIVVQDLGTFNGVKMAVHHFGHVLGASHDGDEFSPNCCRGDGYIMSDAAYNENNVENLFKNLVHSSSWSDCSKYHINKFVSNAKCLFNHPKQDRYPLFSWHELSENSMKFPRDQCPDVNCGDSPCQYLQCQAQDQCVVQERTYAMEGSYCDDLQKKRCYQGECYDGNKLAVPHRYDAVVMKSETFKTQTCKQEYC